MFGTRAAALIVALIGVFTLVQPATAAPFIVTEAQFNRMFPNRNAFYTYSGLKSAMTSFGSFANQGSDTVKKQEFAAAMANFSHETGGLVYIKEINQNGDYCDESKPYGSARLPDSDDVLAKWMALTGDERRLIRTANMHLPGRQVDPGRVRRDLWRLAQWERERSSAHELHQLSRLQEEINADLYRVKDLLDSLFGAGGAVTGVIRHRLRKDGAPAAQPVRTV